MPTALPFHFSAAPSPASLEPSTYFAALPAGLKTYEALHQALAEVLKSPGWYGRNWDALADMLCFTHLVYSDSESDAVSDCGHFHGSRGDVDARDDAEGRVRQVYLAHMELPQTEESEADQRTYLEILYDGVVKARRDTDLKGNIGFEVWFPLSTQRRIEELLDGYEYRGD